MNELLLYVNVVLAIIWWQLVNKEKEKELPENFIKAVNNYLEKSQSE